MSLTNRTPSIDQADSFPFVREFAEEQRIPEEDLIQVFRIESEFHAKILKTSDVATRRLMYADLYAVVHPLLSSVGGSAETSLKRSRNTRLHRTVLLFRHELTGKSVLDVGCGNGDFLFALHELLPHSHLCGIDTSHVVLPKPSEIPSNMRFICHDITTFALDRRFDVVFSNQVMEHLAPADLPDHIRSVQEALFPGGTFIVCVPNRLWGPSDVSRILDNTYRGRITAQGSHLSESTYDELVPLLKTHGFRSIRTIFPFAHAFPLLRPFRISPWPNRWLESAAALRTLTYILRHNGKPVFRNPVVLICRKSKESGAPTGP